MGVFDPVRYKKIRPLICEAIRESSSLDDDWLTDVANVVALIVKDAATDETEAGLIPYVSFFLEEARQGLVDPFSDGESLPAVAEEPPPVSCRRTSFRENVPMGPIRNARLSIS